MGSIPLLLIDDSWILRVKSWIPSLVFPRIIRTSSLRITLILLS